MAGKGSKWERVVAKRLSLWWTQDEEEPRDDVFWRSTTSGARATVRGKKGKNTRNSCGDICALDPIGQPLIDLVTIETKSGYSKCSIQDLLDKGPKAARQEWEKWIEKAVLDSEQAGSFSWLLIVRRDQRKPLAVFPQELYDFMECLGALETNPPILDADVMIGEHRLCFVVTPLDTWLQLVPPGDVAEALGRIRKRRK